ncbi:cyclin-like protein [Xylogone sp. PMI_703]|nr:cyclin-like protein [Xylogone sp. PMI_703]
MAHHQPCDSYFVESDEPSYGPKHDSRELAKLIGRQKQEAIANELSRQACESYMEDIIQHMQQMEEETLPDVASIEIQQEIQWFMRPYLIDFLIEAHAAFQLLPETLFLAVNLLDRYCSRRVVYKRHYQLVGCASLLIAAKYGDKKERVPMIRELKSMCCSLYDEEMFTQMEWHVLNTLDWTIGHPTVDSWLQIALMEGPEYEDIEVEHMALYICEIALYHKDFVSTKPSVMARASLALARGVLGRPEACNTGYDHAENITLVNLSQQLHRPSQVLARKYASPHMSRVSTSLEQFLAEQAAVHQRRQTPPTPPSEQTLNAPPNPHVLSTPQKGQHGNAGNGYLTPPITPEGEYFIAGNEGNRYQPPRCPVTPSPSHHTNPYVQQQYQSSYHHDVIIN